MSTFLHSLAQGAGWLTGSLGGLVAAVLAFSSIKKWLANPMGSLSLRAQHKLFLAYWHKLERKQRYEQMEPLKPILFAYEDGKQPTRKQLKGFKVVTKKTFKFEGDSPKFTTRRFIKPRE